MNLTFVAYQESTQFYVKTTSFTWTPVILESEILLIAELIKRVFER